MGSNDEMRYGASHVQGQLYDLPYTVISKNQEYNKVLNLPSPLKLLSLELTTPKKSRVQNFGYVRELPVLKIFKDSKVLYGSGR